MNADRAPGADGDPAEEGGHTFVRLDRIEETVSPIGFGLHVKFEEPRPDARGDEESPKPNERELAPAPSDTGNSPPPSPASSPPPSEGPGSPAGPGEPGTPPPPDRGGGSGGGTPEGPPVSGNHPPVAVDDFASTDQNTHLVSRMDLDANDFDVDGDQLSVLAGAFATHAGGTVVVASDGSYVYMPRAGFVGIDTVDYTVTDGTASDIGILSITVSAPAEENHPPIARADSASTHESQAVAIPGSVLLANDADPDGDELTVLSVQDALHGTVVWSNGSAIFTPDANFVGVGSFTYTIGDGHGGTSTAAVSIDVSAASGAGNHSPVANPDNATTAEDTPLTIVGATLLANDTDVDGDVLTIVSVGNAVNGAVALDGSGNVVFTPATNYNGTGASFTYTIDDGHGGQSTATANVQVTAVNVALVLSLDADHSHNTIAVQPIGTLFNTGEADAGIALAQGALDAHYAVISAPAGSTVSPTATGLNGAWLSNDADSTWIGSTADEPTGVYQYQTSFTLQAGADPRSTHIAFDVAIDNTLVDILVNGVSTGISTVGFGASTHVELDGAAAFVSGTNTITFVVNNGNFVNDPAPAGGPTGLRIDNIAGTVAVIAGIDTVHQADYATIYVEGTPVSIGDADVLIQDVDSTTLQHATITLVNPQAGDLLTTGTLPAGVTAGIDATGTQITLTGTASLADYQDAIKAIQFGNSSEAPSGAVDRLVTVVVNDGTADSNVATATIHVVPINDAPQAQPDTASAMEAGGVNNSTPGIDPSGNVITNSDSDPEGSVLTVSSVTGAAGGTVGGGTAGIYGTLRLNSDGSYQYTLDNSLASVQALNSGDSLADTFTYQVSDSQGGNTSASLTIAIEGANDSPVFDPSGLGVQNVVANSTFSHPGGGTWPSWQALGNWGGLIPAVFDDFATNYTLTQMGLSGLNAGPGAFGAARVTLSTWWGHYDNPNGRPGDTATVTVSLGGIDYAVLTTPDGGGTAPAPITFLNGATGSVSSAAWSEWTNWTIDLPSSVAASGALRFTLNAGGDDIEINSAKVFVYSSAANAGLTYETTYLDGGVPVSVTHSSSTITDVDNTMMSSARIFIADAQAGDTLTAGTLPAGIAADGYDSTTHTLTLSGVASTGSYVQALRAVAFSSTDTSESSPDRHIEITINDGQGDSNIGTTTVHMSLPSLDAPVPSADAVTTAEDASLTIASSALTGSDTANHKAAASFTSTAHDHSTSGDSLGSDTFVFKLADRGTPGAPAHETIADFTTSGAERDVLDLRDLLVGESHISIDPGTLSNYLHFVNDGAGNTAIQISTTGGFANGFSAAAVDERITLENVTYASFGVTTDNQIISQLLNNGALRTD